MSSLTPYQIINKASPDEPWMRVTVKVRRDVNHFSGLASVVEGLQSLDGILRTEIDVKESPVLMSGLLEMRARLNKFRVNSDPIAELFANFPWLSVLVLAIVVVRDYEKFRSSVPVMLSDAKRCVTGIKGLTAGQREKLVVSVALLIDKLLENSADGLHKWAEKLNRARKAIAGVEGEWPTIAVGDACDE
jgi:hypothetical protein